MRKTGKQLLHMTYWIKREFNRKTLSVHAAHVVFFVMVSFFPFVMFFFSLLQHTPLMEEQLLHIMELYLPGSFNRVLASWIQEAYAKSSGTLLSVSVIATLWSGSKGFIGVTLGLDKIYGSSTPKKWLRKRMESLFYTLSFTGILLISLIVFVYGSKILTAIDSHSPIDFPWYIGISSLRPVMGFTIFFLFFLLMYCYVPGRKAVVKREIPGSFFTSSMWIIFSYLFSIYIDNFNDFSSIYGSLTYIVLFMLWMYICINLLFVGALINQYLLRHA